MKIKKSTILKTVIFLEIIIIISMFFMSDAQKNPAVLVIDVHGEIVGSENQFNSDYWERDGTIKVQADEIAKILKKYKNDDNVKSFVLDIDSNGGDIGKQSELVQEIQKIKKPIISVVRDQALSSGYYVAAGTDRIFANELSNIADIGVVQIIEYKPTPNGEYRKCYVSSCQQG